MLEFHKDQFTSDLLLFLVYIDDVTEALKSNITLYTDETTIDRTVDSHEEAARGMSDDLSRLKR